MDSRLELLGYQRRLFRQASIYMSVLLGGSTHPERVGGDDLKLKAWDIRQDFSQPLFVNKRCDILSDLRVVKLTIRSHIRFDAGITTIQSHPYIEHMIAVGR